MKDSVVITISSHPKYLCLVRDVTSRTGLIHGMPEADIETIKLAVDEACSNVIKYAYNGDTTQEIAVQFRITDRGLEVIIDDNGVKANPELIEGRDLEDVRPGGLGVHLIKRAFDVVSFDEKKEKGNRLILIKYIKDSNKKNEN